MEPETAVFDILVDVSLERDQQNKKWGEQNHPDGTAQPLCEIRADIYKKECDKAAKNGTVTWAHILKEEVYEAFAESDPELLKKELIQVAAVAVQWIECIQRRIKSCQPRT